MKKNAAIKILSVLACSTLLVACGGETESSSIASEESKGGESSSTSASSGASSSSSSASSSSSSSGVEEAEYAIVDRTGEGISITLSKSKAKKGETVTITVAVETNYTLIDIYANKVSCTKVNDTTYTFVMGDSAVAITASIGVVGDVTLSGDLAKVLTRQEDGSYKATITCENETKFLVNAGDKEYGYGAVDFDLSYADIDGAYVANSKATTKIALAGNGIYEITFDASRGSRPVSIYRTGILHAPATSDEISSYFCGSYSGRNVLDGGAYNVKGINHVEYRNSRTNISYVWDLYKDGSFAKATDISTEKSYNVYKSLKDNIYTVVDEYVESGYDADSRPFDYSKLTDTAKFSAKYDVKDEVSNAHYERTAFEAMRDIETPSHELHSVNVEMQYGYSVGFVIEDSLKACDRIFSGKTNEDGSFSTTVSSWKNYQDDDAVHTRFEYEITININKDGTLKDGTYLETYYTEDEFNFDDTASKGGSVKAGKEGKINQSSRYSYSYGAAKDEDISFDTTPYFISSISNLKVKSNADATKEEGHVQYMEVLDESRREPTTKPIDVDTITGYTTALHYDYLPATALDSWQYGIISSDDTSIVNKSADRPSEWIAAGSGMTSITVGNHTSNAVTAKASVTVDDAPAPNGYYVWAIDNETSSNVTTSSAVNLKAGKSLTVYLWGSPYKTIASPVVTCSNSDIKLTLSSSTVKPSAYAISSNPTYLLTIDATSISTDKALSATITVTDKRSSSVNSKIALTINPGTPSLLPSTIAGTTWTAHDYVGVDGVKSTDPRYMDGTFVAATLSFSEDFDKTVNNKDYYKGTLTISSTTYNFIYYYGVTNAGSYYLTLSSGDNGSLNFTIAGSTLEDYGLLGVYAYTQSWGGADDTSTNYLIGYPEEDGEAEEFEWFTLDA